MFRSTTWPASSLKARTESAKLVSEFERSEFVAQHLVGGRGIASVMRSEERVDGRPS